MKMIQPDHTGFKVTSILNILCSQKYKAADGGLMPAAGLLVSNEVSVSDPDPLTEFWAVFRLKPIACPYPMTREEWDEIMDIMRTDDSAGRTLVLIDVDDASGWMVQELVDYLDNRARRLPLTAMAKDMSKVHPALLDRFVCYKGLNSTGHMRFGIYPGHMLQMDKGSLRPMR